MAAERKRTNMREYYKFMFGEKPQHRQPDGTKDSLPLTEEEKMSVIESRRFLALRTEVFVLMDVPGLTLVRGMYVLDKYASLRSMPNHQYILEALETMRGITQMNQLQLRVAPHILRGLDCNIIGGPKSGKTMAYLMPIMSSIITSFDVKKINKVFDKGPLLMVICASTQSADRVYSAATDLLLTHRQRGIICEVVDNTSPQTRDKAKGGVDVLVMTIDVAVKVLATEAWCDFRRLKHFVIKDTNVLLERSPEQLATVMRHFMTYYQRMGSSATQVSQVIMCGKKWRPEMFDWYKDSGGRLTTFISSAYQAIFFSRLQLIADYAPTEYIKLRRVAHLINTSVHQKICVACRTDDIALKIHKFLAQEKIHAFMLPKEENDEGSGWDMITKLKTIKSEWTDTVSGQIVIVCTDMDFHELGITDVTYLIHFDFPMTQPGFSTQSATSIFGARFRCMWSGFNYPLIEEGDGQAQDKGLVSQVLFEGTEEELGVIILNFKESGDLKIKESLSKLADQKYKEYVESLPICNGVKQFGKCSFVGTCKNRHEFYLKELEETPLLPRSGEVEVRIVRVENPSRATGVLHRYFTIDKVNRRRILDTRRSYIANAAKRQIYLNNYYAEEAKRIWLRNPKRDDFCGMKDNDGNYTRAKIIDIVHRYPVVIQCYLVDQGIEMNAHDYDLFELPLGYDLLDPLAVEIIVTNLKPTFENYNYLSDDKLRGRDLVIGEVWMGKICLSIRDTVWLLPLVRLGKAGQVSPSMRKILMDNRVADANDDHLNILINMCKSTGFTCEEFDLVTNAKTDALIDVLKEYTTKGDDFGWAFAKTSQPQDSDSHDMFVTHIENPHCIYANLRSFEKQLQSLLTDLQMYVENAVTDDLSYAKKFIDYYVEGLVVAARGSNNMWMRGIIEEKILSEHEDNGFIFKIRFVDVGLVENDVRPLNMFPILQKYVDRLPFQAIQLQLKHIVPFPEEEWSPGSIQRLNDIFFLNEGCRYIYVKTFKKISDRGEMSCYYAMIFQQVDEIGEDLVKHEFAKYVEELNVELTVNQVKAKLLKALQDKVSHLLDHVQDDDSDDDDCYNESDGRQSTDNPIPSNNQAFPDGYFDVDEDFDTNIVDGNGAKFEEFLQDFKAHFGERFE